jgi:hypothetical protein
MDEYQIKKDREMYQLQKKGYEEIKKALTEQSKESNTTIIIDGEKVESIELKGDPGEPGKTPKKGVDYFTEAEQKAFVDEIMARLPNVKDGISGKDGKDGAPGKDAVVDYNKILDFVKREVAKIPKPQAEKIDYNSVIASVLEKTPKVFPEEVDYDTVKEFIKKEVKSLNLEEIVGRQRGSGGGYQNSPGVRMTLEEISDVNVEGITTGQYLKWDGTGWVAGTPAGGAGAVDSVNSQTGVVVLDADDINDASTIHKFTTAGDISKLAGIEAGADVTDTVNVTAAGALMDSEVDADIKTLSLPANTTISAFGATLVDDADASTARTTIGLGNVDNTSDANKPVSTAQQTALDLKANLASPTFTGPVTLAENASIALDPAGSADGKYTGITVTGVAGYTQAFGDLVYLAVADSRWELADADASATAGPVALAMVVVAGTDGTSCTLLLQGIIRADAKFPTMTVGATQYVGETAGEVQGAIPTGADNVIRTVGYALTADELYFNPSTDWQVTVA